MKSLNKIEEGVYQDSELILIQRKELQRLYRKLRDYEELIQSYEAKQQRLASSNVINKFKID